MRPVMARARRTLSVTNAKARLGRMACRRVAVTTALAAVLGLTAVALPDSTNRQADAVLVATSNAKKVDIGKDMLWVLAVGSDARPGEDMLRSRGDALQLVGINTKTGAAAILGVPRDSWVPIPGHGSNRVNAALYFGGPKLLGETVGNMFGIQPDYVFVTRFKLFQALVGDIGGIMVENPRAFSDQYLRPKGFRQGRIKLNGYDAMAFARSRKALIRGDFDRSANQQRVIKGIQQRVRNLGDRPGFLAKGVASVIRNLHTDLSPAELYRLAHLLTVVDPAKVSNCVLQGSIGNVGGASVVLPFTAQARQMGADAKQDGTVECAG